MSGHIRKWLAAFTVVLTLAAVATLIRPAHDAAPEEDRTQAFIVTPGR
jgi:hypothetical protein